MRSCAARGLVIAGMLIASAGTASAQVETLDPNLASSATISGSDTARIENFVSAHADALSADSFNDVRRARSALLAPLNRTNVTVAFRNAYAQAMWPTVESLLDADDPTRQLTGMRLAGMLGTDAAADRLVDLLVSDDAGVRVFAAGRLGDTLGTVGQTAAAISPEATEQLIDALGDAVANDDEPRVADAAARALERAMEIRAGLLNDARSRAIRVMSESGSSRLAASEGFEDEQAIGFALRASAVVRSAVLTNDPTTAASARAAVGLGADVLAGVVHTYDAQQPATAQQIGLVNAAEGLIFMARRRHAEAVSKGSNFDATNFAAIMQDENVTVRRNFRNGGVKFLEDLEDEYEFDSGRFIRP